MYLTSLKKNQYAHVSWEIKQYSHLDYASKEHVQLDLFVAIIWGSMINIDTWDAS